MGDQLYPSRPVLLVDDDRRFLDTLRSALVSEGFTNVQVAGDQEIDALTSGVGDFSLVLLDIVMPRRSGLDVLRGISERRPDVPVVMFTGLDDSGSVLEAMRAGAFDYVTKPIDPMRLFTTVRRAVDARGIRDENTSLHRSLLGEPNDRPAATAGMVTADPSMLRLFRYMEAIAPSPLPVLVLGETGVGKDLVAQAIHAMSERPGPFVAVNIAGVDDTMLSDTLFGHKRGAFTGADAVRPGLIEQAAHGTLFLDEIGDLSPASQVKLLRLLQDGSYYPGGSDVAKAAAVRVIAATNSSLEQARDAGRFRADLYYRLHAHACRVPPLRERQGDLELLIRHFVAQAAAGMGVAPPLVPREVVMLLRGYGFPGNIRELEGMVHDAVASVEGKVIGLDRLVARMGSPRPLTSVPLVVEPRPQIAFGDPLPTLDEAEVALVAEALERAGGNQTVAARLLGVSRQALNNRLRRGRKETGE